MKITTVILVSWVMTGLCGSLATGSPEEGLKVLTVWFLATTVAAIIKWSDY